MATAGDQTFFDEYEDDDEEFDEDFADDGFVDPLNSNPDVAFASPILSDNGGVLPPATIAVNQRKPASFDDSRRLFQRLWTYEDEIVILEGFLDFVTRRGTTHNNYQHDTGPFYEQIKSKIQLDFNKNQLVEKIRRLKKKYRTIDGRMKAMGEAFSFKSAHEKATYEISQQIWSSTFKRPKKRSNLDGHSNGNGVVDEIGMQQPMLLSAEDPNFALPAATAGQACSPVLSVVEETMKCCLSPLFKELIQHGIGGGINGGASMLTSSALSLSVDGLGNLPVAALEGEKWREQQILELEVYLKRVELLEEHIKATLEQLRSSSSTAAMETND